MHAQLRGIHRSFPVQNQASPVFTVIRQRRVFAAVADDTPNLGEMRFQNPVFRDGGAPPAFSARAVFSDAATVSA
jgi:hypothetical protein